MLTRPGAISGRLRRGGHEFVQIVGQELHVLAGAVFQNEGESAGGADAGNRGRREAEREAIRQLAQAPG